MPVTCGTLNPPQPTILGGRMPNHAMTPHTSGTSLEAQKRYSDGVRDCLINFFEDRPIDRDYLIVDGGRVTSPSYSYAYET